MAYTTADDILKYFNGLTYTDNEGIDNNISSSDVSQFIDEQSVVIDMKIKKKYELPITNANDLTYLKLVCDKLVVCQIDKTLRSYASEEDSNMTRRRNYCKEAKEMLDKLISGTIELAAPQKTFRAFGYNKTTVYDNDCDCRVDEVACND
jgi:hypothetical protein